VCPDDYVEREHTGPEVRVRAPDHERVLRSMRDLVDQELAAAGTGGRRAAFGVDATRVARGPGGCL
jgi:hypothetical protein